jgi:hypothetical protein
MTETNASEWSDKEPIEEQFESAELGAERDHLDAAWRDVQIKIRELLQTGGKTKEQIEDAQWQVESLLKRADRIYSRRAQLNS